MPRRREVPKREILPDPVYQSVTITKFIKKYPGYAHMYCTGYTMGPTVLAVDAALSRNRAANSCSYALGINSSLTAKSQVGMQETVVGNQIRRVTIRLSNK